MTREAASGTPFEVSAVTEPGHPSLEPGVYEHYKGHRYEVLGLARHSETEEWLVVYRALYGEQGQWVRPYDMFVEAVDTAEGPRPRFRRLEP